MNKNNFLYLIIGAFLLSCVRNNNNEISVNEHISIENGKPLTSIIDTIRYVSLKNNNAIFSGRIDKLMSKGDTVYIFDSRISRSLRAYKKDGTFLFNVGKLGKGHGEYIEMGNFTIDKHFFYCIDNAVKKMLIYDIDNGKFVRKIDMPIYADDVARFEDGNFIFYSDNRAEQGLVFIANRDLKIIDELLPYNENDYCMMATLSAFTESADKIVFSSYAKDTIVVFNKKSYLDPIRYVVDFGNYKVSKSEKLDHDKLRKKKYILPPVYIADNIIIGDICLPYPIGNDYWMYGAFVYDIDNNQIYQNGKVDDMLYGNIPMDNKLVLPIEGVVNNEIVSMIASYDRYQTLVKLGFPSAPKQFETLLEDGEPLLIFYSIKNMTEW